MHVHILIKVWDWKWTDWNIHTVPHMESYVSTYLCKGDGVESGTQIDISTHTDACTHSNQGVETEMEVTGTQTPGCQETMHRGGPYMGSQVDINSCTDACTHSKQGVGPQAG